MPKSRDDRSIFTIFQDVSDIGKIGFLPLFTTGKLWHRINRKHTVVSYLGICKRGRFISFRYQAMNLAVLPSGKILKDKKLILLDL